MFRIKKEVSGVVVLFCFWLTACGLPAGPNTALNFANISSPTIPLSASTIDSINPQIAVDGSHRIFVVWQDKANISYSYSTDGGATFQPPVSIIGSGGGTYPRITTDGNNNAFVIWLSSANTFPQNIYLNYAISNTFQLSPVQVSTQGVQFPNFHVPQGDISFNNSTRTLWVTWSQCSSACTGNSIFDIYFSNQTLSGSLTPGSISNSSLSSPFNISNATSPLFSNYYPKIASSGAFTNILYQSTNPSSLILYNTTSGTSFTAGNSSAGASNAALGIDAGGNSYIAWNLNNSPHDILFNILKTGVSLFNTNSLNLTNNANSVGPAIAIDSSQYVYVAFFSRPAANPNAYDVYLERSTNGGKSFTDALNISNSQGDSFSYAPGMAIVGKTAYVVWDDNSATGGNHQIYFKTITFN